MTRPRRGERRREFAPLPPGTATVRISADHDLTRQYLQQLLLADEQVRVVKGPDEYDGTRCYATVQVIPFADDPGAADSLRRPPRKPRARAATKHVARQGQ